MLEQERQHDSRQEKPAMVAGDAESEAGQREGGRIRLQYPLDVPFAVELGDPRRDLRQASGSVVADGRLGLRVDPCIDLGGGILPHPVSPMHALSSRPPGS